MFFCFSRNFWIFLIFYPVCNFTDLYYAKNMIFNLKWVVYRIIRG